MKKVTLILFFTICFSGSYSEGQIVNIGDQTREFDICYAPNLDPNGDGVFQLAELNGDLNGGQYYVTVIEMSASWWPSCYTSLSSFDSFISQYASNDNVFIFTSLADIGQPYSCNQWGSQGISGMPLVVDDTGSPMFNMFSTCEGGACYFPSTVMIDHTMKVHHMDSGWNSSSASNYVNEMLDNLYNSLILATFVNLSINNSDDDDELLNPGEEFEITFTVNNNSFDLSAYDVQATIEDNANIVFNQNSMDFGDININGSSSLTISGYVYEDVVLGDNDFILELTAGLDGSFLKEIPFTINVSLNQAGFPYDSNSEVKPSPLVVDFMGDSDKEILFGDNNGLVHIVDINGNSIETDIFPYDTGDQIWGSISAGYIDGDDNLDIAVTSKSKHLYVLDKDGLKLDYNTNKFLIGTPALGNLDDDADLEIVFGSFSSSPKLYAVNIDGSDVEGFPLDLEKAYSGVALADFNGNGKDDIVIGTEQDEIYLIYDNGVIASGFPFVTSDKIRSAPSIINTGSTQFILACSEDENIYGINDDGSLKFSVQADDEIHTSPTFLESSQGLMIFFGSDSGTIYSIDINGSLYDGYPIFSSDANHGGIVGSIMFDDLDSDNIAEIIYGDENGYLHVLKSGDVNYSNLTRYNSFPAQNTFGYASSVSIEDIDSDGDLEIIAGTTGDVAVFDIKETGQSGEYWNVYRGNYQRTGFYQSESQCSPGDINFDNILNVLDIVTIVNIVVNSPEITNEQQCAADLNSDGIVNVLDIVTLVNIIIST